MGDLFWEKSSEPNLFINDVVFIIVVFIIILPKITTFKLLMWINFAKPANVSPPLA